MGKRTPVVEWYMAESDAEWTRLCAPLLPDNELTANRRRPLNRYFWSVAVLLLLLAGAGEWWRRSTETSLYVGEAELRTTVRQKPLAVVTPGSDSLVTSIMNERTNADWWLQYGWEDFSVSTPPVESVAPTVAVPVARDDAPTDKPITIVAVAVG